MKRMLFNVRPELNDEATDIKVIKVSCSECEEGTLYGWEYTLNNQIHQLLADQVCTTCKNKIMSKELTTEFEQKRIDAMISQWWHLTEEQKFGFKNYQTYNHCTQLAKEKSINYVNLFSRDELKDEKNLLLMGNTGTGKTHLSKAIARTLKARGFKVGYLTSVELFNKIKATYNNGSTERLYKDMKKLELLVIDDIGVETIKVDDVSWSIKTWTEIIDCRLGLPNIWTTNLDDLKLPTIVGQRAFSRMYENTRFIDLFTDDYRKRKQVQ